MEIINHYIDGNDLKKEVTKANIEVIKKPDIKSHNTVEEVYINKIRGFLKKSVDEYGKSISSLDKYEYLVSKISKLYNLKSAEEYLVYDQDSVSLFSKSVINENEKLIMTTNLSYEIIRQINIPEQMIEDIKTNGVSNEEELFNKYNLSQEKISKLLKIKDVLKTFNEQIIDL